MSELLDDFTELKERTEACTAQANKSQGAISQLKKTIKKDFGCATVKSAKVELIKIKKDETKAKTAYEKASANFKKEWANELDLD